MQRRSVESIFISGNYGPHLGKNRVYVLDFLQRYYSHDNLLGFRVLQLGFLVTLLGWKIPTCVALNMPDGELLLPCISVSTECNSLTTRRSELAACHRSGDFTNGLSNACSQSSQEVPGLLHKP